MKKKIILGIFSLFLAVFAINSSNNNNPFEKEWFGTGETPSTSPTQNQPQSPTFPRINNSSFYYDQHTTSSPVNQYTQISPHNIQISPHNLSNYSRNNQSSTAIYSDDNQLSPEHSSQNNNGNDPENTLIIPTLPISNLANYISTSPTTSDRKSVSPTEPTTPHHGSINRNLAEKWITYNSETQSLLHGDLKKLGETILTLSPELTQATPGKRAQKKEAAKKYAQQLTGLDLDKLNPEQLQNLQASLRSRHILNGKGNSPESSVTLSYIIDSMLKTK